MWKYCKGEVPEPNEKSSASDHELWKKEMNRAKELLYDAMTDEIMKSVKHGQTPFRIVERLKQRYVGKTYFKYAEALTKLRRLRLGQGANVADHLGEVRRLMDHAALLGKPLDDYIKPAMLIGSLST